MPTVPKLNFSLYNTNKNLLILLTLFCCALFIDISVKEWVVLSPGITVVFILVILLYIDYVKNWWASVVFIALFFLTFISIFPALANHGNLELFFSLAFFIVYGRRMVTGKGISADTVTCCFRYSLITIYFIAGFHKLNEGFFTISGSCSAYVTQGLNLFIYNKYIIYPEVVVKILQYGTIAIEMIVPFGLLFHRTRKVTVCILLIFHFYLSLCGFSNFSAFATFLIAGCVINLQEQPKLKLLKAVKVYILFTIAAAIAAYLYRKFGWGIRQGALVVNGIIFNVGMIYLFYHLLYRKTIVPSQHKANLLPYLFVLLISLWGLQAYIGLSNTATLTMFSNLVTEKSRSNHYIINTKYTKIWDFEEDYVTIIRLPEEEKKWGKTYKIENYDLPVLEFKKLATRWTDSYGYKKISCTILYKGKEIELEDIAGSNFNDTKWWYRFLYYRRIPKNSINECMW